MTVTQRSESRESLILGAFAPDGDGGGPEDRNGFGFLASPMELLRLPPEPSGDPPALVLWGTDDEPAHA